MKRSFLIVCLTCLLLQVTAQKVSKADAELIARIDKIMTAAYPSGGTGATVLVSRKGDILYQKAFGMANLELGVPMNPDHVFRIGSISKQFTAVAILQLSEQGKLSLQDEITKFIPTYPMHGYKITVEQLLNHTSGIKNVTDMKEWDEQVQRKDFTPEALIDFFKYQPMDFAPGTKWSYSNSGYILLGVIIEKASGISYTKYIEDNFFKPLGMNHSYYDDSRKLIRNRVSGYEPGKDTVTNTGYLSMTQPYSAGSLLSTVGDLFKWNQAVQGYKLLKKESVSKAFTEGFLPNGKSMEYGYGWGIGELSGSKTVEHSGGINGSLTNAIYIPENEVYVAVLSNCTCKPPTDASIKIAAAVTGKTIGSHKAVSTKGIDLKKYEGAYENEDGILRYVQMDGDTLKSQRGGGSKLPLHMYENGKFFYENTLSSLEFIEKDGKIISHLYRTGTRYPSTWVKTHKPFPDQQKTVTIDPAILKTYEGNYTITQNFAIEITSEGNRLFAQATGQDKFELFATDASHWFLKVVDAKVEFVKDSSGNISTLILDQGGSKMEAKKIN